MRIRHTGLLRFKPTATPEEIAAVRDALLDLPAVIPEIAVYRVGVDAGLVDGNWDLAVSADFASVDDWRVYTDHPAHRAIIAERIQPLLDERAAVQFALPD